MTNSKSTKRALFTSALAMLACVAMLIGTTFAWFTDTASTSVNKIQAGTLKVELLDSEGHSLEGETLSWQKAADHENEEVLWEPGATYRLQPITIKNAGNLALKYKVVITGINGDAKLNEVIDWTITVGEYTYAADSEFYLAAEGSNVLTISGKMQTSAGNEYQGLSIDGIAITVYATQAPVEYDSENNTYDENADYLIPWDGSEGDASNVPGVDANDNMIHIASAADLTNFAASVNAGTSYVGQTVVLDSNIDLGGHTWAPIGQTGNNNGSDTYFMGTFDGQGHTIYGLNVDTSAGLGSNRNVTAGLFGWVDAGGATIKNLTISGASVKGCHYTGALVGYFSGTIENCSVVNSTIVSTAFDSDNDGDKVGGLVGYMNANATVKNSSVSGSSVSGKRDVGGLVGCPYNTTCTVTNNTVSDTTVTYSTNYSGEIVGRLNLGFTVDSSNTASNVTMLNGTYVANGVAQTAANTYAISNAAGLDWFNNQVNNNNSSFGGCTLKLAADIDYQNSEWLPVGQNYALDYAALGYANPTEFGGIFDGDGHTISNIKIGKLTSTQVLQLNNNTAEESGGTTDHAIHSVGFIGYSAGGQVKNLTIKNAVVTGYHYVGTIVGYGDVNTVIDNCHVVDSAVSGTHLSDNQCGDKVGGLMGFYSNNRLTVSNCSVKSTTVTAARDAAKVIGYASGTTGLSGLSADNVTVTAVVGDCDHERAGTVSANALVGNGTAAGLTIG